MKKILGIIVLICTFCIVMINVEAESSYNGESGSASALGASCSGVRNCPFNYNVDMVRLHLIYYDGSSRKKIGRYVYFASKKNYISIPVANWITNRGDKIIYDSRISGDPKISKYNIKFLENYFLGGDSTTSEEVTKIVMEEFNVNPEELSQESQEGIGYYHKGYRIIIEPFMSYIATDIDAIGFITAKDLMKDTEIGKKAVSQVSNYLTVVYDDIGIRKVTGPTDKKDSVVDPNSGWGMNIINIGYKLDTKKCFEITTTSTPLICTNTNKNNIATFLEVYESKVCDLASEDEKNATKEGKLVYENGQCKINCTESVIASLPGHKMGPITVGTYFEWPSLGTKIDSMFQFHVKGTRTCKMTKCGNFTPTIDLVYNDFNASAAVEY